MNGVTEPCPWCRGATIKTRHLGQWAGVDMYAALCQTEGCGATGPTRDTEPAAIAAWNRRAPGWRPIETAPRDKMLLLAHVEDTAPLIGYWYRSAWREHNGKGSPCRPTHWQPLPTPPETAP